MGTKLVVISNDAMITEDIPNFAKYPVFEAYFKEAAYVPRVRSIYPTLTYPCHTTMVTGCLPDRHGITANTLFLPGTAPLPWCFYHDAVKCPDLFDAAKNAGLTTASVGWPVTGNHPSIDYLLDEIWPLENVTKETMSAAIRGSGTSDEVFEKCVLPHLHLRVPRVMPRSSYFNTAVACAILREYRPDVLTIHIGHMDGYRHKEGVFGPLTERGAGDSAEIFSQIRAALADNGDLDSCNIVLTSDHGQMDCTRKIHPNVLLKDRGFLTVSEDGKLLDWQVYCLSCGMSAYLYLRDPSDRALHDEVFSLFTELTKNGLYGFSQIRTVEETAAEEHLRGDFSFVLETDNYTSFGDRWTGPYCEPAPLQLTSNRIGSHGFHPDKGPRPPFFGAGPAFRPGAVLPEARLADEAPTLAAVLGISLADTDGRVLTELLR